MEKEQRKNGIILKKMETQPENKNKEALVRALYIALFLAVVYGIMRLIIWVV